MKKVFTLALLLASAIAHSQLLSWTPDFVQESTTPVVITMDASYGNKGLLNYTPTSDVYVHIGVITNKSTGPSNWLHVLNANFNVAYPNAQCTYIGNNKWTFTITGGLRSFFGITDPTETVQKIAILFRNGAGTIKQANASGNDMYIPVYTSGTLYARIDNPFRQPEYNPIPEVINPIIGNPLPIVGKASLAGSTIQLYLNGNLLSTVTGTVDSIAPVITTGGTQTIIEVASNGANVSRDTISFYIAQTVVAPLPSSVVINGVPHEGINYYGCTDSVTLVLFAPYKTSAMVIGDFSGSNWTSQPQYQMYQTPDGNYYWLTLHGVIPGIQYAFQYLVDNSLYIADPYSEVILDGNNDKYIPAATYPGLKAYPTNANVSTGKNGLIGVLQSCQTQYNWKATNFVPPASQNLIIEETLVRDFANTDGAGNFKMLTDSLKYFKNLGINAIELMPVAEFSGNDSWGYNPNFYCALDKAYGTKTMYKTFIDSCHANGIAVIMDVVYNQVDDNGLQVPQARLYWDQNAVPYPKSAPQQHGAPAANNPWLNQAAPHPYGVFDDLNHTSTATQYWVERSLSYWLTEYHIDGFRFDLAKGFTQNCTNDTTIMCPAGNNPSIPSVENYDPSRVSNLERYYDYVKANHPGKTMPYMILEFLAGNTPSPEENTYANYGFMTWTSILTSGNPSQTAWPQNTLGTSTNANLSRAVYSSNEQGFSIPASIDYAGSHDDERMAYATEAYGTAPSVKSISGPGGVLQRQAAAAALLFGMPGPHMFYQFDERGYDISEGGNTSYKAPNWQYLTSDANAVARRACVAAYTKLINLRLSLPGVFNSKGFGYDLFDGGNLFRRFQIGDPVTGIGVTIIANFATSAQTRTVTFPTTGTWYNYQSNGTLTGLNGASSTSFSLSTASQSITLQPGEYHVYIYQPSTVYTFTGNGNWNVASNWLVGSMPPSTLPSGSIINVAPVTGGQAILNVQQNVSSGATFNVVSGTLSIPLNLNITK